MKNDRLYRVLDDIKDMDVYLKPETNIDLVRRIMTDGNHFLLRHIAINTAIIADYIDRIIERGDDD